MIHLLPTNIGMTTCSTLSVKINNHHVAELASSSHFTK